MYGRLLLLPASMVRSCLIYKLGKLTSPLSDFKQSLRRLPSGNSLNSELKPPPPHAFGIPNCVTPHAFGIPLQETPPPSPSEFQDAAHGMVLIFSGITHLSNRCRRSCLVRIVSMYDIIYKIIS